MKDIFIFIFSVSLLLFYSCVHTNNSEPPLVKINLTNVYSDSVTGSKNNQSNHRVAVSAMISPKEGFKYYQDLINYVSRKINIPYRIIQKKTYQEVNDMLNQEQVDFAFICSGAYVKEKEKNDFFFQAEDGIRDISV